MTALCALGLATGCAREEYSVTGCVRNARNGEPIAGATIAACSRDTLRTQTGREGYYVLPGVLRRDTILVSAGGYKPSSYVAVFSMGAARSGKHDVYLEPDVDTAFTSAGPVDARIFLESESLKQKKLSWNEARLILVDEFPGARVRKGALVVVSGEEEWLCEIKIGHASASVYMDARSGKIRSIESDDPTMDRTLQSHVAR